MVVSPIGEPYFPLKRVSKPFGVPDPPPVVELYSLPEFCARASEIYRFFVVVICTIAIKIKTRKHKDINSNPDRLRTACLDRYVISS